jgi:hypothetical protein
MDFDIEHILIAGIAIVSVIVGLPAIILSFILKFFKDKREKDVEKLKYRQEILRLELKKQRNQLRLLEKQNEALDKTIFAGEKKVLD